MNSQDYLYACAEAGVALSGFAALAIALRSREDPEHSQYMRGFVATMIERGLAASLFALAPILVMSFSDSERVAWSVCSAAMVVYAVSVIVRSINDRNRNIEARKLAGNKIVLLLFAIGTPATLAPAFNVVPMGVTQGPHWYLLAITWLLASAGYMFWFLVRAWVRDA